MHEYSLVQSLLSQVEALCREHGGDRVVDVAVRVGEFAGVQPELFRDAFDVQTEILWEHPVSLTMHVEPVEAECLSCRRVFHIERFHFQCPDCDAQEIKILSGEDVILENVVLEQTTRPPDHPPAEKLTA